MTAAKRPFLRPIYLVFIVAAFLLAGCTQTTDTNWPGLAAYDNLLVVSSGTQVLAYDADTQQLAWSFPAEPGRANFFQEPSVQNGRLVIGDYGVPGGFFSPTAIVTLYGVQVGDDIVSELWTDDQLATDRYVAPVLQVDDRAFVGTADNKVFAVDAVTGETLWPAPFETGHSVWGQPIFEDGILYVSSLDRAVHALNADTGEEIRKWEVDGAIAGRPVLGNGFIYVTSFDGQLHALNMNDETEAWTAEAADWIWGSPALASNAVIFADVQGNVYAADPLNGSILWQSQVTGAVQTRPVVFGGTVFIASEGDLETELGQLTALSLTDGSVLWSQTTPAPLYTTPVIVNDTVVVTMQSESALLMGFDTAVGSQRWVIAPPTNN